MLHDLARLGGVNALLQTHHFRLTEHRKVQLIDLLLGLKYAGADVIQAKLVLSFRVSSSHA